MSISVTFQDYLFNQVVTEQVIFHKWDYGFGRPSSSSGSVWSPAARHLLVYIGQKCGNHLVDFPWLSRT